MKVNWPVRSFLLPPATRVALGSLSLAVACTECVVVRLRNCGVVLTTNIFFKRQSRVCFKGEQSL
uniref:Uncharacterized protein n=1 Tax=Anguilla anguilla TaxID=7936 RepID=A0A0E9RKR7_ANGAN